MRNLYEELDDLLKKAKEAPAELSLEMSYKDMASKTRKLRREWSRRQGAADQEKEQMANAIMAVLNDISEQMHSEEEKAAYDKELKAFQETEAEKKRLKEEEERRLREEIERANAEKRRELERLEAERRAKEAKERAERAAREEEEQRRRAEEERQRAWEKRAWRPSIIGMVANIAIILILLWPICSFAGMLPNGLALGPIDSFTEYVRSVGRQEKEEGLEWINSVEKEMGNPEGAYSLASLFDEKNANATVSNKIFASVNELGIGFYESGFAFRVSNDFSIRYALPVAYDMSDRPFVGIRGEGNLKYWNIYLADKDKIIGSSFGNKHYKKESEWYKDLEGMEPEQLRRHLYELLSSTENVGEKGYYQCAYEKAQGVLIDYRDGEAWFVEDQGDKLLLYVMGPEDAESRLLYTLERDYKGDGCGYIMLDGDFFYASEDGLYHVSRSGESTEPTLYLKTEGNVHCLNYTRIDEVQVIMYIAEGENKLQMYSTVTGTGKYISLEHSDAAVYAYEGVIWTIYENHYPEWMNAFGQNGNYAMRMLEINNQKKGKVFYNYTLYNSLFDKVIKHDWTGYSVNTVDLERLEEKSETEQNPENQENQDNQEEEE